VRDLRNGNVSHGKECKGEKVVLTTDKRLEIGYHGSIFLSIDALLFVLFFMYPLKYLIRSENERLERQYENNFLNHGMMIYIRGGVNYVTF